MMLRNILNKNLLFAVGLSMLLLSCGEQKSSSPSDTVKNTDTVNLKFTVEAAPEWTDLFNRQHGWFGADGIFSIPLNGVDTTSNSEDSTLLIFSDSMLGDIENGQLQPGFKMINNSVAYIQGTTPSKDAIKFVWDSSEKKPASVFIPNTPASQKGDYYWLGDGFVNHELNNSTYIFGHRVRSVKGGTFGFKEMGTSMIIIPAGSRAPFKNLRQIDMPMVYEGTDDNKYVSFGVGVFVNTKEAGALNADGYVYVYGVRGADKSVVVARVKPADIENFAEWRYWDGKTWNADIHSVSNITNRTSNELSVTPLKDGRYAMVFQTDGIGTSVGLRLSTSPEGPFGPIIKIWECPEIKTSKNFIAYNAKAHPNLSKPGELLISYNINSFEFEKDIVKYPDLYRPRFIRVKMQ